MPKFQENIPLSRFSNYKIGGPARFFFDAKSEADVRWAVKEAKAKKIPIFVLGGGTNLLIDDRGWNGLVLRVHVQGTKAKGTALAVGAGASMDDLLNVSVKKSLSGLEWAGGLPGTLGGAIRGNAGCFGGEMKDVLVSVRSFDTATMKIVTRPAAKCGFGYRESIFKKKNGREIILGATLRLIKGDKKKIAAAIREKIMHRETHHPLQHPNIGSIFKNVPLALMYKKESASYRRTLAAGTLAFRGSTFSIKNDPFPVIYATKLIAESGLRGVSFGGAMISPKHPNFIVNVLGANSGDVKRLMGLAKTEVKNKFGVVLDEEVQIVES
jgi:UDP-N-acetylmuramate dehydrogenase